jgi:NAD(P)-dependent dehydrogenase (short-subunit alcohol dehydrogenase family)
MVSLSGKNALITGALGTIGRALVARFQEEGASVIALDLPSLDGEAVLSATAGNVRYCGCDLGDLVETEQTVGKLAQDVGGVDTLINNAAFITNRPHEDYTIAEYEKEIRINSTAAFIVSRVCSAHMKDVGSGKIICLTSLTLNGQWDGFVR